MTLKFKKPVTPSQRGQVSLNTSHLDKNLIFQKESFLQTLETTFEKGVSDENYSIIEKSDFEFSRIKDNFNSILKQKAKILRKGKIKKAGRNNQGVITVRRRGGGHKQNYKQVTFKRNNLPFQLMVYAIHQDPNRSADLALLGPVFAVDSCEYNTIQKTDSKVESKKGSVDFFYILAPKGLKVGDKVKNESCLQQRSLKGVNMQNFFKKEMEASYTENPQPGDSMPLYKMPMGAQIHNLEIHPGLGGQLVRSAGTQAQIIEKALEKGFVRVRLPSGGQRWIPLTCRATLGVVGNEDYRHIVLGKAGASRWRGRRPKVRGVAMNPVDHPHGGGEGRTSGGRPSVTPWGRPTRSFRLHKKKINPFTVKITGRKHLFFFVN